MAVRSACIAERGWFAFFYFASTAASTVRNGGCAIGRDGRGGSRAGLTFRRSTAIVG
jgi:hypothetical protein